MILINLSILAFGKLNHKTLELRPGMNIITGDNESGKTTVAEFIRAMLFGLTAGEPEYERYRPKSGNLYGGEMDVLVDGIGYRIKRSFSDSSLHIYRKKDFTEIENPEEWLRDSLKTDKETYSSMGFLSDHTFEEDSALFSRNEEKTAHEKEEKKLQSEYRAAREVLLQKRAGYTALRKDNLYDEMKKTKALLSDENKLLTKYEEKIRQSETELEDVKSIYKEALRKADEENASRENAMKERLTKAKEAYDDYLSEMTKEIHKPNRLGTLFFVLFALSLIAGLFYNSAFRILSEQRYTDILFLVFCGATVIFFILGIVFSVLTNKHRSKAKKKMKTPSSYESEYAEENNRWNDYLLHRDERKVLPENGELLANRIVSLREEKDKLLKEQADLRTETDELMSKVNSFQDEEEKQREIRKEIKSIDLAVASFERLGHLTGGEDMDIIEDIATDYYTHIFTDPTISISLRNDLFTITKNGETRDVSEFSTSQKQAAFFSYRLSRLQFSDPEKRLPLIADDILENFDEEHMKACMDMLRRTKRQAIVFFSRRKREAENEGDL